MLKIVVVLARLFISVPVLEFLGFCLVVAGVAGLAGAWWALIAAGALCFVKAFDLALPKGD